jgi:hypothetical protein
MERDEGISIEKQDLARLQARTIAIAPPPGLASTPPRSRT